MQCKEGAQGAGLARGVGTGICAGAGAQACTSAVSFAGRWQESKSTSVNRDAGQAEKKMTD